ncbi:MAG: outer membrane beta-barrel protein [Gammaproteobacteria bacterium]
MTARLARLPLARSLSVAALPLVTGGWLAIAASPAAADDADGGPRYTYFDAGYQWVDANYAIKQNGGQHEGIKLAGSLGLLDTGRFGVHVFGEFFDGDFSGVRTTCDGGEGGPTSFSGNRTSQSVAGGLGVNFAVSEKTDIVLRGAYVDISKFETPNSACQLVSGDDHGYFGEVMVRSEMSDKVEIEAGFRYSDLSDSKVSNNDVLLGIGYHLTDYLTIRARGVVFDDDTGLEIGARVYFGSFLGRDTVF